jgi:hypothetical protein
MRDSNLAQLASSLLVLSAQRPIGLDLFLRRRNTNI